MVVLNETIGRAPDQSEKDAGPIQNKNLLATVGGLAVAELATAAPAETRTPSTEEMEEMGGVAIDFSHRRGLTIQGPLGMPMKIDKSFNMVEVQALWDEGVSVPLDLMPLDYWHRSAAIHDPGLYAGSGHTAMPFSEEALGADF